MGSNPPFAFVEFVHKDDAEEACTFETSEI